MGMSVEVSEQAVRGGLPRTFCTMWRQAVMRAVMRALADRAGAAFLSTRCAHSQRALAARLGNCKHAEARLMGVAGSPVYQWLAVVYHVHLVQCGRGGTESA